MSNWGVIFDLDGLLVDSEPIQERAIGGVLARYGVHLTSQDFTGMVGLSTEDNFKNVLAEHGPFEQLEVLLETKDRDYRELARRELQPRPGAVKLVRSLVAAGVPIAIASSSPVEDVHVSLEAVGLSDAVPVDLRVGGDMVAETKPAPDLYLEALRRLDLPADVCVALEDSGPGVASARAAGLACIAVPGALTRHHDFTPANTVYQSLQDLRVRALELRARRCGGC